MATKTGTSQPEFIEGTVNNDTLRGSGGNDTVYGDSGDDRLYGGDDNDLLIGAIGKDTLDGGSGDDGAYYYLGGDTVTTGVSFDASIIGSAETVSITDPYGNQDTLTSIEYVWIYGTSFGDTMTGGAGNDTLMDGDGEVGFGTIVTGGDDVIRSGDGNDSIGINYGDDSVVAGAGDDTISFYAGRFQSGIEVGNSTVNGGSGTDTAIFYFTAGNNFNGPATLDASNMSAVGVTFGDSTGVHSLIGIEQIVVQGSSGDDSIVGGSGNDTLWGNNGNDTLVGGAGADTLYGFAGDASLDGGLGADLMEGSIGSNTYTVDNVGDVIEDDGYGTDTVRAKIDWTLNDSLENLTLIGTASIDGTGNTGNNRITGNASSNALNGKEGNDTLVGGLGNDIYTVDASGDVVTETSTLATEIDTVKATVSWTLGANLENLRLIEAGDINATGNELANVLTGNAGDNTLNGRDGADTLIGGLGNDTYIVDAAGDVVTETSTVSTEIDLVRASVTFALSGTQVENLTLIGTGNIKGTGSSGDNVLVGNAGNNVLNAGAGTDTVTGGAGADDFELRSTTGSDVVTDFLSGTDDLRVVQSSLSIGDGDAIVEGARRVAGPGGFAASAELVILTADIAGDITTNRAAVAIGSADSNYAVGATRIFVVDNGTDSAVYLFTASNADARVSAAELTLLATLQGTASLATADIEFGG